jgi:uncharacterized protein YndB with AHSA1/START domain
VKWLVSCVAGALYGLTMRGVFGLFSAQSPKYFPDGPMLVSFIMLVPAVIGVITVYTAPKRNLLVGLFGPWPAVVAFAFGCGLLLWEGAICIAMALPIFLVVSSISGMITVLAHRWFQPPPRSVAAFAVLPLLLAIGERQIPLPQPIDQETVSVIIDATPATVWQVITKADTIRADELGDALSYRIGVPRPMSASVSDTAQGKIREVRWAHGVKFDEPITDWDENRYIRWRYRFAPDAFPVGTFDEHFAIGGRYFDLVDTAYTLTPEHGQTRLTMAVRYRVSTGFNWYARPVGRWMIRDTSDALLQFYKTRGEHGTTGS